MPSFLHRRNQLTDRQSVIILALAAAAGVAAAFAGCHPTGTVGVDQVLTAGLAVLVTWSGATTVWWVPAVSGALLAVAQPSSWQVWVSVAATLTALAVGAIRASAPIARCLAAAALANVALRLDVHRWFGESAVIAAVAMGLVVGTGLQRRSQHVRKVTLRVGLVLGGFTAFALALLLVAGLTARGNIVKGVRSASAGLRSLRTGDNVAAADSLDEAAASLDRKSTRLNSSHTDISRMPSSA